MAIAKLAPNSRNLPNQLTLNDQPAHHGGEGSVYFTTDGQYAVKIYHRPASDKQRLLKQVLDLGRNLGDDERFLAWPLGIINEIDGEPTVGVVTRCVPPTHAPLYRFIYSPKDAIKQFGEGRSWLNYLKMARSTAAAVRTIHGKGMAHADIHLKNFLADPESGEVVLIDLDGLVVRGFLPPQVKGMPGFIAPEVLMAKAQPSELTDRHSAAVLILWILLLRNVMLTQTCIDEDDDRHDDELGYGKFACFSEHPIERRNWISQIGIPLFRKGALSFRMLTPKLQALTEKALIEGLHEPSKRPQVIEWERALSEAYDALIGCPSCHQSFVYPYWLTPPLRQCPLCGSNVIPPFPAVLELLEPRSKGTLVALRTIVLYQGMPLFADVVEPGRLPPFTRRGSASIGQVAWETNERGYRLTNTGNDFWQLSSGERIKPGASVSLHKGAMINFGNDKRVMRVVL